MRFEGRDRLIRMTPLRDGTGKVIAGLAIAQDITELRLAETTVRESERRLFSFLDSLPVAVYILNAEGKAYYSNQLATRLLGQGIVPNAPLAELLQIYGVFRAGTDELYPAELTPPAMALQGKSTMIDDAEIDRPDGRMAVQCWGSPILDEMGRVIYSLSVFSDITAQKRFATALRQSEERFRAVFEEGPLGMAIVSTDYRFLEVNHALCEMTGYYGDELVGHSFTEITHPNDRDLHTPQMGPLERGDISVLDFEKRYVRKDGGVIWVRVSVRPVRDAKKRTLHFITMIQDVTYQHVAREEIRHLAYHDALTGLPNRRLMLDRTEQAVSHARRYSGELAILSIDLDGLKSASTTSTVTPPPTRSSSRQPAGWRGRSAIATRRAAWAVTSSSSSFPKQAHPTPKSSASALQTRWLNPSFTTAAHSSRRPVSAPGSIFRTALMLSRRSKPPTQPCTLRKNLAVRPSDCPSL